MMNFANFKKNTQTVTKFTSGRALSALTGAPQSKKTLAISLFALFAAGCANQSDYSSQLTNPTVADLQIVDCLLPGQVRQLGNRASYITARRPVNTTAADCRIRGGEYVAYDRANLKSSLNVWMPTAQLGNAEAQANVGEIFERGLGGVPNYAAAVIWYRKAAEQGNARAQFNLGTLYEQGFGVPKSKKTALNWYRKAWGLTSDTLIYQSTADAQLQAQGQQAQQQQNALRKQLQSKIDNKSSQIAALNREVQSLALQTEALGSQQGEAVNTARNEANKQVTAAVAQSQQAKAAARQAREEVQSAKLRELRAKKQAQLARTQALQAQAQAQRAQAQAQEAIAKAKQAKESAQQQAQLIEREQSLAKAKRVEEQAAQAKTKAEQARLQAKALAAANFRAQQETKKLAAATALAQAQVQSLTQANAKAQQQVQALEQAQSVEKAQSAQAIQLAQQRQSEIEELKNQIAQLEEENKEARLQVTQLPVFREPAPAASQQSAKAGVSASISAKGLKFGKYYALVIGNQSYKSLDSLDTPRRDAQQVANLLKAKYGFSVQLLLDANNIQVMKAINNLNSRLKAEDNLLIFYAGHGSRVSSGETEEGYWLPVNAELPPADTFWVSNEFVTRHLSRIKAKRVLVVADSCYAGLLSSAPSYLFLGGDAERSKKYLQYKLAKKSRLILSSGGDKPVLDNAGQGNSVFARAFLQVLKSNNEVLAGPQLFTQLRDRVKRGAKVVGYNQVPVFKAIKGAGHEVGDFFFVPAI